MQQEQRSGLNLDGFYLDLQCTGVPVGAHKSVCDGYPPVSDHILPTPRQCGPAAQPPPKRSRRAARTTARPAAHNIGPWPLAASQEPQPSPFRS